MSKAVKKIFILLSLFLFLPWMGCLEFDEIVQLRPDGHVDWTLRVELPEFPDQKKSATSEDEQKRWERDVEAIFQSLGASAQLNKKEEKTENGRRSFTLSASLNSLASIDQIHDYLAERSKAAGRDNLNPIFGQKSEYRIKKTGSGTLLFTRSFTAPPDILADKSKKQAGNQEGKEYSEFAKGMEMAMFNAIVFRFEFFSPTQVVRSNAAQTFANNLRWEASLGYLSKQALKMEFEIASTPELEAASLKK